ncbi:MAG: response regulator [Verrucomicrobiota bacterium]
MKRKVRVLLCDDQPLVRTNVRKAIGNMPGFEVVGEAEAGNVGVQMATDLAVDLVVMDVCMPELDGIEATRQILAKAPDVKVIIFTSGIDEQAIPNALSAGAHGYLLKDASSGEMHHALKSVMSGERYLSSNFKTEAPKTDIQPTAHIGDSIKAREGHVYRVVLVDDSAVVRERVAATLSSLGGVQVVGQAGDVPDGLRLVRETKPDLLILDIGLPGESGITLLETAKQEQLVPLIMMLTNQDHPKLRQHCAELGADFYFHKPTEFEKMIDLCFELANFQQNPPPPTKQDSAPASFKIPVQTIDPEEHRAVKLAHANEQLRNEIAERQRVEQALRESQERYRQFLQMTSDGLARYEAAAPLSIELPEADQVDYILDHARVVECNDAFARQFGFNQATDAVGMRLADCMAGTHEEKLELVRLFIRSGYRLSDLEAPDNHRSGQIIWTRNSLVGIVENNHLVRAWIMQQDITQRRQIEERIREQAQMLDLAHDAIIIRDLEDRVLYWNESARNLYGWAAEEVLGRRIAEFLPGDTTTSLEVRRTIFEKDEWIGEVRLNARNGDEIIVESRLTLIRDRHGKPKSMLAINTNITERKRLETQFMRSQRMESIGMLAGGIAHDLNNVLAPIIMSSQLLDMELADPEQKKLLGIILASAKRGADLVRQVLTFYRSDQQTHEELSATHLIKELRHIVGETFPKSIKASSNVAKGLWPVAGDPTQLHQVLLNLCVNARDAMPAGGELSIKAENVIAANPLNTLSGNPAKPTPHVLMSVTDTGTGIPPEIREKIFDPFFTTKAPGKGTGLGLSTTLAIVKNHGGFIQVQSEINKGSVFQIYLPALERAAPAPTHTEQFQIPRGRGELVLVVDDEASVRLIMAQTLQTFGYRTVTANNGAEAIAIYEQRAAEIAVVLVDMMMPVLDGAATIRKLAEINPQLKVIAASGLETSDALARTGESCAHAFLPKPYTAGTLLKALHKILSEGGETKGDVVAAAMQSSAGGNES